MDESFDTMIDDLRKAGVSVRLLKSKELDAWKTSTKYEEVQATWVKEQDGNGVKDARPVLEKIKVILNDAMQ